MGQLSNKNYYHSQANSTLSWHYMVCPTQSYLGQGQAVCKMAYMAVMDIREITIDYAQKKIRDGTSQEALLEKDLGETHDRLRSNLTIEECFNYYEIDHEHYQNSLKCFVKLSRVPNTVAGLITTAFLVDFFEICGEQEV